MRKAAVIGAGFSGLATAFYLVERGFGVEIYEKGAKPGGLIQTLETPWGLCEMAANGLLNSLMLQDLAKKIELELVPAEKASRRRFIFREKPSQWPLSILATLTLIIRLIFSSRRPKPNESIAQWGERVLGLAATTYLLAPALQGIYAGDIQRLSASLILSRFFRKEKVKKPRYRGTVSPAKGMSDFFSTLERYLTSRHVVFHYESSVCLNEITAEVKVVATDSESAASLLESVSVETSQMLRAIERIPICSVTAFFSRASADLDGFGVLFPRTEGFQTLGVLFNASIFPGRSAYRSETWILGGALAPDPSGMTDETILELILDDRSRLYGAASPKPLGVKITRWPKALPHYTLELEKIINEIEPALQRLETDHIYIAGNYLGRIGLSQLLEKAAALATKIEKNEKGNAS